MTNSKEEWIRERLVIRLYEALPPDEEAAVETYLRDHPELVDLEQEYEEIARGVSTLDPGIDSFSDDEVAALVSSYRASADSGGVMTRSRVTRWLAAAAVAASLLVVVLSQGVAIEIGGVRLAVGQRGGPAQTDLDRLREAVSTEFTKNFVPYLAGLSVRSRNQEQQLRELVDVFMAWRERDREEFRNTFTRLARNAEMVTYTPVMEETGQRENTLGFPSPDGSQGRTDSDVGTKN